MLPDPKFTSQISPHLVAVLKKPIMDRIGQPHNITTKPGSLMKYTLCNMKSLFTARRSLHCNYAGKLVNMEVVEFLTRMLLESFLRPLSYSFTRISLQVGDELFEQYALWAIDFGGPCRIRTKETLRVRGESTPRTCHYQQVPVHTWLGEMILVDIANGKPCHGPYRDSKFTFLLQNSVGGNSKIVIIATFSPSNCCAMETLSALKFSQCA